MSKQTVFLAVSCFQESATKGAAKLASAVLRAAAKAKIQGCINVFLDEATGSDAQLFAKVPFLPTEHAVCLLVGDADDCVAMAKAMVQGGRKTVFTRKLDGMTESLRLQALVDERGITVSEESPYFDDALLAKASIDVQRLPAGLPLQ